MLLLGSRKKTPCVITLLFLLHLYQQAVAALDNKGTEFFIPFLPNYDSNAQALQLHLTAEVATTVTIEYPAKEPTFIASFEITPEKITTVELPLTADNWRPGEIANNTVRAFSTNEFVAYAANLNTTTSDAALALPVDTMNTDYIIASYFPAYGGSQFIVYAAYDNSTVTITSPVSTAFTTAGVPHTLTLSRGEAYYLNGNSNDDLSGTIIEASRPVGVINGTECANVPSDTSACDTVFEVAQPTQSWGKTILSANLPNRPSGSVYRVYASADDTEVTLDNVRLGKINRGEFIETKVIDGDHIFEGSNAIYVVQYMTGQTYQGAVSGDPAMGNMIPIGQFQKDYTFSTIGNGQFALQFLTIIASTSDVGRVQLDGSPIEAKHFNAIADSGFSTAIIELNEGTHTTSSPATSEYGHGITVEGFNSYNSFIYPGGAMFQFLNPIGDANPPICTITDNGVGTANDQRTSEDKNGNGILDDGEDINANGIVDEDTGIFFVELTTSTNTTMAVTPFTPADGTVSFNISQVDEQKAGFAAVSITDGAGNVCSANIAFSANIPMPCDADGDSDVDVDDLWAIVAARNTPADTNEAMDIDQDGTITLNDARLCALQYSHKWCASHELF